MHGQGRSFRREKSVFISLHKLEAPGKMDCQLRNCLCQLACGLVCGRFLVRDPRARRLAIPGQVLLGCIRRQA